MCTAAVCAAERATPRRGATKRVVGRPFPWPPLGSALAPCPLLLWRLPSGNGATASRRRSTEHARRRRLCAEVATEACWDRPAAWKPDGRLLCAAPATCISDATSRTPLPSELTRDTYHQSEKKKKNVVAVVLMQRNPLCKSNLIICCCCNSGEQASAGAVLPRLSAESDERPLRAKLLCENVIYVFPLVPKLRSIAALRPHALPCDSLKQVEVLRIG